MFEWVPGLVPGLLQTPAYIKALFASTSLPKPDIDKRIMVRLARREVLTRRNPLQYRVLIGEPALRERIGDREVMAGQLTHLLATARTRNVSLRVLPSGLGYHPGLYGPFVIFDFLDLPPIVHLEHYRGSGYIYDEQHLADYRAASKSLLALALTEAESEQFIQEVSAELEA